MKIEALGKVGEVKAGEATRAPEVLRRPEGPDEHGEARATGAGARTELSPEDVKRAAEALDETARAVNARLSFVYHEESGRMQVKVIDVETQEVIREIPPTEVLELVARIREMIGLFLDKKV
ncbi:MAG: flagellar protein FlaG [Bacillota bacterium]|nr:flagellar protein FlaG [Bacillota bacterium]MDK2925311.1 flagellar protein FlaG [Bacillota bacterium]